jgi:hypothetical protein
MVEKLTEMGRRAGSDELRLALEAGLLEVDPLLSSDDAFSSKRLVEILVARIGDLLQTESSYPLFDDGAGGLVRAGLEEGLFQTRPAGQRRARQAALAAGLIDHLPAFPTAGMDEVLDARRELGAPLARFRASMARLAREASTEAYDPEFAAYLEDLWVQEVEPALEEIREIIKSRPSLVELARGALEIYGGASLGLVISDLTELPGVLGLATGGVAAGALELAWDREQRRREARRTDMYWSYLTSVDRLTLGSVGVPTPASAPSSSAGWPGSAGPQGPLVFACSSSESAGDR